MVFFDFVVFPFATTGKNWLWLLSFGRVASGHGGAILRIAKALENFGSKLC